MGTARLDLKVPTRDFDVEVALDVGAETVALVGPSGAGKTTILRAIAGLAKPTSRLVAANGEVWFDSERRIDRRPEERAVGYVFQEYALFPHLSVERNVAFAGGEPGDLLERLGIGDLAKAKPTELSGGERQRVALARALAHKPQILLLDEPMAALDPHTRGRVRAELRTLLRELGLPSILVTHDFLDAAALADRIAVLVEGRIVQTGTAEELIASPGDAVRRRARGRKPPHRPGPAARRWAHRGRARLGRDDPVHGRGGRPGRSRHPSMGDLALEDGDRAIRLRTGCERRSRASCRSGTAVESGSAR